MRTAFIISAILFSFVAKGQRIESIHFNLYTDSLKKGVHNYINVDGKYPNGNYLPLMSNEIVFSSTDGKWEGNSLIFDSTFSKDSVIVTAHLKERPEVKKSITIYLKKLLIEPPLKTEKELLEEWKKSSRRKVS